MKAILSRKIGSRGSFQREFSFEPSLGQTRSSDQGIEKEEEKKEKNSEEEPKQEQVSETAKILIPFREQLMGKEG